MIASVGHSQRDALPTCGQASSIQLEKGILSFGLAHLRSIRNPDTLFPVNLYIKIHLSGVAIVNH